MTAVWLKRSAHIIHSPHDQLMFRSARIRSSTRSDHARLTFRSARVSGSAREEELGKGESSSHDSSHFWLTCSVHIIHSPHDQLMFRSARIRSSTRSDHTPDLRFVQRAFPVQPAKKSWGKVNHPATSHFWLTRSAHIIHSPHDHLMFRSARIRSSTRSDHARLTSCSVTLSLLLWAGVQEG